MDKSKKVKLDKSAKKMFEKTKKQISISKIDEIKSVYVSDLNPDLKYFEPKKINRWILEFPTNMGLDIKSYFCKSVTRPKFPFNSGDKIYLELYDPVADSTTHKLYKFINKQKPFELNLSLLDPLGNKVEKWNFGDCVISSISWPKLDYGSDLPITINVEITYNKIKLDE